MPALAALTGTLVLRRAVASPLGVRRQAQPARAGVFRLLPLSLGLAMLVGAYADRQALLSGAWYGRALLLGGAVLCLVGLAVGAAALARVAGLTVAGWGPGLASNSTDGLLLAGDLLVPPSLLPDTWFPNLLVATDGRAETLEAVRARLGAQQTPFPPLTAEEAVLLARSSTDGYTRAALLMAMAIAVVLAGGLPLAVTAADGIRERHRAHSALTAMGTPARVLRRIE